MDFLNISIPELKLTNVSRNFTVVTEMKGKEEMTPGKQLLLITFLN